MVATTANAPEVDKEKSTDEQLAKVPETPKISKVVVHPLVLLSVVDHYIRLGKVIGGQKRVVGVLLGALRGNVLDISNSFAVPFEEDQSDKSVWFLDHDYLESMFTMFKKVNARERVVGWYHSGPKLSPNDIRINELFQRYNPNSVLVIIDVKLNDAQGLPTEAYIAVEEVHDDGTPTSKTFDHLPSEIGAEEAEEVGVEHLLRDIKDTTIGSLSQQIGRQLNGLHGLHDQLKDIFEYLDLVVTGKLQINHQVIYNLQDVFNLLPDLSLHEMVKSMYTKTNDQMLVVYQASMIRCILALHDLINNKLANRESERSEDSGSNRTTTTPAGDEKKKAAASNGTAAANSSEPASSNKDSKK